MATKTAHKQKAIRDNFGDLNQVIPDSVNRIGQAKTAVMLGVSQFTISKWLKENGYVQIRKWEKKEVLTQK